MALRSRHWNPVVLAINVLRVILRNLMNTTLIIGWSLRVVVLIVVFANFTLETGALWICPGLNLVRSLLEAPNGLLVIVTLLFTITIEGLDSTLLVKVVSTVRPTSTPGTRETVLPPRVGLTYGAYD